jgi:hypothetical protein
MLFLFSCVLGLTAWAVLIHNTFWLWQNYISRGTKSVLIGAHAFWLHPFFVAAAWWKLYGFPFDPRLWAAFFLHDLGYVGKMAMDSEDGELHPILGARIMHVLFDWAPIWPSSRWTEQTYKWYNFTLCHSRHLAKRYNMPFSRLCVADKLAGVLTPTWLYLPMVTLTGEIEEYLENARKHFAANPDKARPEFEAMASGDKKKWHKAFQQYMKIWVNEFRDGKQDTWTPNRYGKAA